MATVAYLLAVLASLCLGPLNTGIHASRMSKQLNSKTKFSDTIDIDNAQRNGHHFVEGSGNDRDDDGDDDDGGDPFENQEIGSGTSEGSGGHLSVPRPLTKCLQLLNSMNNQRKTGSYVPRCTSSGEFAPIQCNGGTDECWCADRLGQQIAGTRRRAPDSPNCNNLGQKKPIAKDFPSTRPPNKSTSRTTRLFAPTLTPPQQHIVVVMATKQNGLEPNNKIDAMPPYGIEMSGINVVLPDIGTNEVEQPQSRRIDRSPITSQPGILAGIISAAVVCLLCTVLLVMFVIYRLRQKHEQELYIVDKPKMGTVLSYASHCSDAYG